MTDPASGTFKLTREDILRRRAERDRLAERIEALRRQLAAEDRYFEALALILPPDFLPPDVLPTDVLPAELPPDPAPAGAVADPGEAPPSPPPARGAENGEGAGSERTSVWKAAIDGALTAAGRGLLPREIVAAIREDGSAEARKRLAGNPNGVYVPLGRMVEEGAVAKHGDRFYKPAVLARLAAGGGPAEDGRSDRVIGVGLFVLNAIRTNGPLLPRHLLELMRLNGEYGPRVTANVQYGYGALQRLLKQGHLAKDAQGRYRLAVGGTDSAGAFG